MAGRNPQQKILDIFQKYDENGDGGISIEELSCVLLELGKFNNTQIKAIFSRMDKNHDGSIQYEEFVDWVFGGSERQDAQAKAAMMADGNSQIQRLFHSFCGGGQTEMDGKSFAKLCKDAQLTDKKFTATDVDLIFSKAVQKGQRRIDFDAFLVALRLLGEKKGVDEEDLERSLAKCAGPKIQGTRSDQVRFHDDKSTYTGTHHGKTDPGGAPPVPSAAAPQAATRSVPGVFATASKPGALARAPPAANRGRPGPSARSPSPSGRPRAAGRSPSPAAARAPSAGSSSSQGPSAGQREAYATEGLRGAFEAFCGGRPDLDGRGFVKVCKDSGLLDRSFSATDADVIFAKVVVRGMRRIGLQQFAEALDHVAAKKGVEVSHVERTVRLSGGPMLHGTRADDVRFHDDVGGGRR